MSTLPLAIQEYSLGQDIFILLTKTALITTLHSNIPKQLLAIKTEESLLLNSSCPTQEYHFPMLTLKVLVATIDAQWEGMGDVGSARYEPALLPSCLTLRVLSYSNYYIFRNSAL